MLLLSMWLRICTGKAIYQNKSHFNNSYSTLVLGCKESEYEEDFQCRNCWSFHPYALKCRITGKHPEFEATECFGFFESTLENGRCVPTCPPGQYIDIFTEGDQCKSCSAHLPHCQKCHPSYHTNPYYDFHLECSKCINGFFEGDHAAFKWGCYTCPESGLCSECNSDGSCKTCVRGYYRNSQGTCSSCEKDQFHCSECTGKNACTDCKALGGYKEFYPPTCHQICLDNIPYCDSCQNLDPSTMGCYSCIDGYVVKDNRCVPCDEIFPHCDICDNVCYSCKDQYVFIGDNCVECKFAFPNCLECSGTSCIKCRDGFYLENDKCLPCNTTCLSCNFQNNCTTCHDDMVLRNGSCLKCSDAFVKCTKCSENICVKCESELTLVQSICQYIETPNLNDKKSARLLIDFCIPFLITAL